MSKQYLQTLTIPNAHASDIFSMAVTPSSLLTASGSSTICIFSTKRQAIHPDTSDDENPYPLLQRLEQVHQLGCHHVCASLDGKTAATVGFGGEIKIWEGLPEGEWQEKSGVITDQQHAGEHWAPALNENGQFLACTTSDGRINVYDLFTLSAGHVQKVTEYQTKGSFGMSVDVSPNGDMTASGHQNGGIYIFSNAARRLMYSLSGLVGPVRCVKFSPANRYLAAAGDARILALYDTQSGEQVANFTGHSSWIMCLDWNWSGEYLLSGSHDGRAKIWSIERRECVATQTESDKCLWSVKWLFHSPSARNEVFVAAGAGRTLAFYREATGT